jgi:enterochelin esterase-like enzyme
MKLILLTVFILITILVSHAAPIMFKLQPHKITKTKGSQWFTDTIFSKSFGENRLLTIYLPKDFKTKRTYPVIYMADGQLLIESYVRSIDSLIDNKIIPEIVVIGVHSNETLIPSMGLEYRNFEYIKNLYGGKDTLNLRFAKHFQFFTSEVIEYAEKNFSVSSNKEDRTFYGISNGSDFGVTVAQDKPDLIGNYILCSIVSGSKEAFTWTKDNCPRFFLATGDQEDEMVQDEAKRLGDYLLKISIPFQLEFYHGGHERKKWETQFIATLPKVYSRDFKERN